MSAMAMVMVVNLLLLGLLSLFAALIDSLDVVVEDCSNDGDHVGLDDTGTDIFRASDADVDHALKSEIPLPHAHHIFAATLFKDADKTLDATIDSEDIADTCRRRSEVGEMVERVDEGESRSAVEGTAVVQGGGDAHGRLVNIGDAKVDFPHDCESIRWTGLVKGRFRTKGREGLFR